MTFSNWIAGAPETVALALRLAGEQQGCDNGRDLELCLGAPPSAERVAEFQNRHPDRNAKNRMQLACFLK